MGIWVTVQIIVPRYRGWPRELLPDIVQSDSRFVFININFGIFLSYLENNVHNELLRVTRDVYSQETVLLSLALI